MRSHELFFCPECNSVQPANMDTASDQYFQMFGMDEPAFDLDPQWLEQTYKGLQRQLHPDKFSTASPLEKEYAHQQAAVVNAAYDVLKKPLRRAHYIVSLYLTGSSGPGFWLPHPPVLLPMDSSSGPRPLPHTPHTPLPAPACLQLNHQGYGACEGMTITDPVLLMSVLRSMHLVCLLPARS
jgi:hypothetical protein